MLEVLVEARPDSRIWTASGGTNPGLSYGASDEFGFNATENKIHVHDFLAHRAALPRH